MFFRNKLLGEGEGETNPRTRFTHPINQRFKTWLKTTGLLLAMIGFFPFGLLGDSSLVESTKGLKSQRSLNQPTVLLVCFTAYLLMVLKAIHAGDLGVNKSDQKSPISALGCRNPRYNLGTTWNTAWRLHMTIAWDIPTPVTPSKGVAPCRDLPNPTLFSKIKGPKNWKQMERQISTQLFVVENKKGITSSRPNRPPNFFWGVWWVVKSSMLFRFPKPMATMRFLSNIFKTEELQTRQDLVFSQFLGKMPSRRRDRMVHSLTAFWCMSVMRVSPT